MIKICDYAIVKPLLIIFKNCISFGGFPDTWKKSNICPIDKKNDKQIIQNYRPVSLLPICGKLFERLIFNSLFNCLEENKLLSAYQSGFRCNDSFVSQLIAIALIAIADTSLFSTGYDNNTWAFKWKTHSTLT